MKLKIRRWIMFHKFTDFLWLQRLLCLFVGHDPQVDQCQIPEHDYCSWCMKLVPRKASA